MSISLNSRDPDGYDLRSATTWETLYRFLKIRVRYWVHSSQVSLWHGQEEDIIADIVQEAVTSTFTYASTYFSGLKEGERLPSDSLKFLGAAIAYKQYQQLKHQDSRFRYIQLHRFSSNGCLIIYEQGDPLERTSTQEWLCNRLAEKIAKISSSPRRTLLIDLANRMHFDTPSAMPMQRALLKQGIRLQDYQQPLPNHPPARSRHLALLHHAYQQIIRQREEQENTETIYTSQDPVTAAESTNPGPIENDPELTDLAEHLETAAPPAIANPAFRKALQDKLLDVLAEYRTQVGKAVPGNTSETAGEGSGVNSTPSYQDPAIAADTIDLNTIESDLGLIALAACLDTTAVPDLHNPDSWEGLLCEPEDTPVGEVEWALEMTERVLNSESRE